MFLTSPMPLAPVSGFVAFDGGGTSVRPIIARAPVVHRAPAVEPAVLPQAAPAADLEPGLRQSATWQPSSGRNVRRVESAVLVAICGYFAFGLAGLLNWI